MSKSRVGKSEDAYTRKFNRNMKIIDTLFIVWIVAEVLFFVFWGMSYFHVAVPFLSYR